MAENEKLGSAQDYYNRGVEFLEKDDYDKAILYFNKVIQLDKNYTYAYAHRGFSYLKKGDNDKAIADCTQAIRLNPDYTTPYFTRGIAYGGKHDYDMAIADHETVLQRNPNNVEAREFLELALKARSDLQAIEESVKPKNEKLTNAENHIAKGIAFSEKGDFDQAIVEFTKVIELAPNSIAGYYNRAGIYSKKEDNDNAIKDFSKVIELNPAYIDAHRGRAFKYGLKGEWDKVIADFESVLQLDPNNAEAKEMLEIAKRQKQRQ